MADATPSRPTRPRPPARPPIRRTLGRTDSAPGRRPALDDRLVLEARLLEARASVSAGDRGVRTVSGTRGDVRAPLVIPEADRRAGGRVGRDSVAAPDSVPAARRPCLPVRRARRPVR